MIFQENTNEKWQEIRTNKAYADMIDDVRKYADDHINKPIESLSVNKFLIYYDTGNRSVYQSYYYERRGRLNSFAAMCMISDDEKYLRALEDTIWAICDEFTWALPAHIPNELPLYNKIAFIDLFAAETGFALSEIHHMLKNRLSPIISERIKYEVRRRIIAPYLAKTNTLWWETGTNNWAAVCAGSVGCAFMYLASEAEFSQALPRLLDTTECFLSGYADDGCCTEGYSYWKYGFGFFTMFAQLIYQYTNGEIDYFKRDKIKKIAEYQQKIILSDNVAVSFSDGGKNFKHKICLTHFYCKKYNDIEIPDIRFREKFSDDDCYRWGLFIRNFLWFDPSLPESTLSKRSYCFENAQWYIKRMPGYAFAAKAGNNDEPHNHNDIGSFIFVKNGAQELCDLGCGEYTRQYFEAEFRYSIFVNGSQSHSVPVINGLYQHEGKSFAAEAVSFSDNEFSFDMQNAYDTDIINRLNRRFEISDNGVVLTDTYSFNTVPRSVTERFISPFAPEVSDNIVKIGKTVINFDSNQFECAVSSEIYSDHSCRPATAYIIDFNVKNPSSEFSCRFEIN